MESILIEFSRLTVHTKPLKCAKYLPNSLVNFVTHLSSNFWEICFTAYLPTRWALPFEPIRMKLRELVVLWAREITLWSHAMAQTGHFVTTLAKLHVRHLWRRLVGQALWQRYMTNRIYVPLICELDWANNAKIEFVAITTMFCKNHKTVCHTSRYAFVTVTKFFF